MPGSVRSRAQELEVDSGSDVVTESLKVMAAAAESQCDAARTDKKAAVRHWQDALMELSGRDQALQVRPMHLQYAFQT